MAYHADTREGDLLYKSFTQNMLPDIQEALILASAEIELAQARTEISVSELKLKDLSLYQKLTYTLVAIVCALTMTLVLSLILWLSSKKIEALRLVHTLKGTARTLGLTDFQECAHKLEDELKSSSSTTLRQGLECLEDIGGQYAEAWQPVPVVGSSQAQTILEIVASLKPGLRKQLQAAGY